MCDANFFFEKSMSRGSMVEKISLKQIKIIKNLEGCRKKAEKSQKITITPSY